MTPGEIAADRAMTAEHQRELARYVLRCPDCGGHGVIVCHDLSGRTWRDECTGCHGEGIIEAGRLVVAR